MRASLRIHLVFAPDGRLAERQLVEMPSGKILVRETYGADGTVACVTDDKKEAGGTPAPRRKILLAPCGAPELKPDAALVVLPLPLRSRQQALGTRKLLADENYGSWSEEDALAAIAADLGEGPVEMKQIIGQRFFRRGDRRVGFYTLLLSAGLKWNPKEKQAFQGGDPLLVDPLADHPHDPLAKYVAAYLASSQPGGPKDFGDPAESRSRRPEQAPGHPRYPLAGRGSVPTGDFFRQLAEFHDLWERWHDGRATAGDEAQQRQEHQRVLAFIESAQPPEFGWGLLMAIRGVLPADTFHDGFAAAIPRFQTVPGLRYAARYELARACNAEDGFRKLFTETLETGIVPRIDGSFREVLQRGDGQQWQTTIRAAAKKLIDAGARQSAVYLAFQVQQVDDPALAEEVFDMALCGAPESERLGLTLARIEHFRQTKQRPRADALLQTVLNDKRYAGWPALWYLAEAIAGDRGMTARAIGFRQRAMDIEFEHLPEKVNIDVIRSDYGQLLSRYEKLATAIGPLHEAASPELLAGVIRAADRWRQLDADPTAACQAAARVLGELGETDLAWDYLTTPLSVQANQAASWTNLAQMLRQQGHVDLADRAFVAACDAEPTNAQVLWDRGIALGKRPAGPGPAAIPADRHRFLGPAVLRPAEPGETIRGEVRTSEPRKQVHLWPILDFVGWLVQERIDDAGVILAVLAGIAVEEDRPVDAVVAADQQRGSAGEQTGVPFGVLVGLGCRPNAPATGVVIRLRPPLRSVADRSRRRREHRANALRAQDRRAPRVVQGDGKAEQVHRRGDPSAVGIHRFDAFDPVGQGRLRADLRPADGPARALLAIVVFYLAGRTVLEKILAQLHAANAQGGENPLPHDLVVGLPRYGLDDPAQHAVAKVRIDVGRARIEIQRLAQHVTDDLPGVHRQRDLQGLGDLFGGPGRHRVERFVAVPAARVLQAIPHGDVVPAGVQAGPSFEMRFELQKRKHPLVELEFAVFDQVHHGRGGKGLAHAGNTKQRSGPHRFMLFHVGKAKAAGVDQATVIGDGQGRAGRFVLAHERGHQLVIGGQSWHDGPCDLAKNPPSGSRYPELPESQARGGRGKEPAARRTRATADR